MIDSLYLANGISLDRSEQHLYLSETMMDRVLRYDVDVAAGTVSGREVYQAVYTPDNLSVDADDNLWVASPLFNQVVVVDPVCKSLHTVFSAPSDKNARLANAWIERSHLGQGLLELLGPDAWYPLPGTLTGMCWSADRKTIYILGLGNAAVKCHI